MRIILILLLLFGLVYFYTDRQLYFYGKSDLKVYHPLPINVTPEYWGYDIGNIGFVLVDDFDFVLVGNGKKYNLSEVVVNEIIKYGFDEEKIFVVISDSVGNEHELKLQSEDESEIDVSVVETMNDYSKLTWVEIKGKDKYISQLEWIRSLIRIGFFILIMVVGYRIVRILVRRGNTPTTSM